MSYAQTTTLIKLAAASDSPLILMPGGTRSGKTIATLMYLTTISERTQDNLIGITTDTAPALRDGAFRDFHNLLRGTRRETEFEENKTDRIFTNRYTHTQIQFFALDDEMKARGSARDYLYVNEANRISWETFEQLHIRTRVQTICDWNPSSRFWAYDQYIDNPKATGYQTFTTTYQDNEALDPRIVNNIENHDRQSNWWRVYGLGQLGELENNIYKGWQRLDNLPPSRELIGYGLDYGNSPDPTAMVALWRSEGMIIFEQVFEHGNLLNSQLTELIRLAVSERGDRPIICDYGGGGAALIEELQRAGLQAVNADKGAGSVLAGIDMVRQIPHVGYVGADLEREYLAYQHRVKRGSGEVLPTPQDGNDHLLDALRYGWYVLHADEMEREASLLRASMYEEDDDGMGGAWV